MFFNITPVNQISEAYKLKKDSKLKIASKYALALYNSAAEKKALGKVKEDISKFAAIIDSDKDFIKDLSNPIWEVSSKKEALKAIAKKTNLSEETLGCLYIIADNNRFPELLAILQEFENVYYKKQNIVPVSVETVKSLNSAQDNKLRTSLEKHLSKKVIIDYAIKPEILGGLVIRFGSNMIDDSLKGKLNQIEQIMKGGQ